MSASDQRPASGESARHGLPELIAERRAKAARVRASDPEAFPYAFAGAEPIAQILAAYAHLADGEENEDLLASEEARKLFVDRARIVSAVRAYLDGGGFVEVETPVLQPLYGGALARPFTTYHNALERTLFLRIATELYLKRLLVGGLERVYELGKDFRNEGVSTKHNPEFTMVEFYEAYADYADEAVRLEELVRAAAGAVAYDGPLDFASRWRRVTFFEAIAQASGIDLSATREEGA